MNFKLSNTSKWILGLGILAILSPFFHLYKQNTTTKRELYESTLVYSQKTAPKLSKFIDEGFAHKLNPELGNIVVASFADLFDYRTDDGLKAILSPINIIIGKKILNPFGKSKIKITSEYGPRVMTKGRGKRKKEYAQFHTGVDIIPEPDSLGYIDGRHPIAAGHEGYVVQAGWNGKHGKSVVIESYAGNGYREFMQCSHLSKIGKEVQVGRWVEGGQIIGKMGHTGNGKGSHLHFEYYTLPVEYSVYADRYSGYLKEKKKNKDAKIELEKGYLDPTNLLPETKYSRRAERRIRSFASIINIIKKEKEKKKITF
jgi:murein DD-endopeptidase MepM/ murein hydrolase activator NlpD